MELFLILSDIGYLTSILVLSIKIISFRKKIKRLEYEKSEEYRETLPYPLPVSGTHNYYLELATYFLLNKNYPYFKDHRTREQDREHFRFSTPVFSERGHYFHFSSYQMSKEKLSSGNYMSLSIELRIHAGTLKGNHPYPGMYDDKKLMIEMSQGYKKPLQRIVPGCSQSRLVTKLELLYNQYSTSTVDLEDDISTEIVEDEAYTTEKIELQG